jgi:hypothetical protein
VPYLSWDIVRNTLSICNVDRGFIPLFFLVAAHCKESRQTGYVYNNFYAMNADDTKKAIFAPNVAFEMHIAIQASSNGHILLSPDSFPYHNTSVYEIGGWFSILLTLCPSLFFFLLPLSH